MSVIRVTRSPASPELGAEVQPPEVHGRVSHAPRSACSFTCQVLDVLDFLIFFYYFITYYLEGRCFS